MLHPGLIKDVEKLDRAHECGKLPLSGRLRQAPAYSSITAEVRM